MTAFHKRHPPVGSRPGTLAIAADAAPPRLHAFQYDTEGVEEHPVADVAAAKALLRPDRVTWIDVQGLGDEATLRGLADLFEIHPLALEDVANAPQRPKIEAYERQLLFVTRMIHLGEGDVLTAEQVSLFVGPSFVLTFQERYGDVLDPVRRRIREGKGPIRAAGAGYLAYALLDTIVDGYYPVIEQLGEDLERLEARVMARPSPKHLDRLNHIKAALARMTRSILPQREALSRLLRDGSPFVPADVLVYLRDTHDHAAQLADVVESLRDSGNGLLNTYLSLVSMRTNDVMKVLTIMASIFIPLTFLAGIYGMNFEAMPELQARWAYPTLLGVMGLCAIAMLVYFRRKGWLGGDDGGEEG